ncbi:hypothetical protein GCM10010326_00160 [Streptomyces xanthochromogenes]|uniref:Uncharacterized protein n=1 Tax=Streptomyces xanthochromogenes TaxID=67384 RepID=A0ABQ2ZG53_9ACTN|nr:hypothetical protein GCM10010326_00160 [Streptomyces xanthochromogenes]
MLGGAVQIGAACQYVLESAGLVFVEPVGVAGDPAGHIPHRGLAAGWGLAREGFAEAVDVLADDLFLAAVAALADFFEETPGDGVAFGVPLVDIGLRGREC